MIIKQDARGIWSTKTKESNRKKIIEFFQENPSASYREASMVLRLSPNTIQRHVKAVESGN